MSVLGKNRRVRRVRRVRRGKSHGIASLRAKRRNLSKCWDCFPTLRFGRNDYFCLRKSYK